MDTKDVQLKAKGIGGRTEKAADRAIHDHPVLWLAIECQCPSPPAGTFVQGERRVDAKRQPDRPFEFLSGHPDIVEHVIIQPLHAPKPPATAQGVNQVAGLMN